MSFNDLLSALRAICTEVEPVRNARIDLVCTTENEAAVRALLFANQYFIRYRFDNNGSIEMRVE